MDSRVYGLCNGTRYTCKRWTDSVVSVNAGWDTSFPVCVDGDAVMMNKGDTATVSVDSDAVCCTLLLRKLSDTATVSVDGYYVEGVIDIPRGTGIRFEGINFKTTLAAVAND